jgi:hypothetical protein
MTLLLDELADLSVGLVITVDEVDISVDELRELVSTFQFFVGERREVALVLAGLPKKVMGLVTDGSISFLRRATHRHLGLLHPHEARESFKRTVESSGRSIDEIALATATEASGGYPYLIQLIGYHMWRQNPSRKSVTEDDVHEGVKFARAEMERVFEAILSEISEQDIGFLTAMTFDEHDSSISDIAQRLGVSMTYAGQYRLRLIGQGLIGARRRGMIGFELPMFKEYLREKAAAQ